jgi:hypothetical protein
MWLKELSDGTCSAQATIRDRMRATVIPSIPAERRPLLEPRVERRRKQLPQVIHVDLVSS